MTLKTTAQPDSCWMTGHTETELLLENGPQAPSLLRVIK